MRHFQTYHRTFLLSVAVAAYSGWMLLVLAYLLRAPTEGKAQNGGDVAAGTDLTVRPPACRHALIALAYLRAAHGRGAT